MTNPRHTIIRNSMDVDNTLA